MSSNILEELALVKQASVDQTAVSQLLAQEVAGKMGGLDAKSVEAQQKIDSFIGGGFALRVSGVRDITVYVDPVNGDDSLDGSTSALAIKTSEKLNGLVGQSRYDTVTIFLRRGKQFDLKHLISALVRVSIQPWAGIEVAEAKPILRQALAKLCGFSTPELYLYDVECFTYAASENEELPPIYDSRAFLYGCRQLTLLSSDVSVFDNQIFHIHASGSGDHFHRRSISAYFSTLSVLSSSPNVINSEKNIVSWYGSGVVIPFDFFVRNLSIQLNGIHSDLGAFLNVPADELSTNVSLTMV